MSPPPPTATGATRAKTPSSSPPSSHSHSHSPSSSSPSPIVAGGEGKETIINGHNPGSHHPSGQRGLLADIIASIYEPGINRGLLVLMHFSFLALLASLATLLWVTRGRNVHVLILAIIATSLYVIIIWFVRELSATLEKQRELVEKQK